MTTNAEAMAGSGEPGRRSRARRRMLPVVLVLVSSLLLGFTCQKREGGFFHSVDVESRTVVVEDRDTAELSCARVPEHGQVFLADVALVETSLIELAELAGYKYMDFYGHESRGDCFIAYVVVAIHNSEVDGPGDGEPDEDPLPRGGP